MITQVPESTDLSRESFAEILDNIFGNVFVTDGKGRLLYLNDSAASSLGVTKSQILGKTVYYLLESGITRRSITAEALEKGDTVVGIAWTGTNIELATTSKPLFDSEGNVKMVVTYSQQTPYMDSFISAINKEKQEQAVYKQALAYLSFAKIRGDTIIVRNEKMKRIFETIDMVAKTDSTVILYGESGVGKDIVATYLHQNSLRSRESFIPVNCAAIPVELMESEFFGYVRGAFTGANDKGKPGFFEMANKGTLFFDEIAELSLDLQAKLLRVIESGEVRRIGSTESPKTMDARIVAATNKDLMELVCKGKFREDLYYRLNVVQITIPPLRERTDEIPLLAEAFLEKFNSKYSRSKVLSPEIIAKFSAYQWPGNIRELRNVIEQMVVTSPVDQLTVFDGPVHMVGVMEKQTASSRVLSFPPMEKNMGADAGTDHNLKDIMSDYESRYISQMLEKCSGNVSEAAKRLGIHRSVLYKKMKEIR